MNNITGVTNAMLGSSTVNRSSNQNTQRTKAPTLDQRTTDLIGSRDQNGDGLLTAQEMKVSAEVFSTIDTNNNGTADRTELNNAFAAYRAADQNARGANGPTLDQRTTALIGSRDRNGDGLLTAQEMKVSAEVFSTIDTNNNGTADRTELNNAYLAGHAADQYLKTANSSAANAAAGSAASYAPVNILA